MGLQMVPQTSTDPQNVRMLPPKPFKIEANCSQNCSMMAALSPCPTHPPHQQNHQPHSATIHQYTEIQCNDFRRELDLLPPTAPALKPWARWRGMPAWATGYCGFGPTTVDAPDYNGCIGSKGPKGAQRAKGAPSLQYILAVSLNCSPIAPVGAAVLSG